MASAWDVELKKVANIPQIDSPLVKVKKIVHWHRFNPTQANSLEKVAVFRVPAVPFRVR